MTSTLGNGLLLALGSGLTAGNAMLPLKFTRRWKWENTWLVFSVLALGAIPWLLALLLVKEAGQVYRQLQARQVAVPMLFGAGWGFSHVLFGISVARLGIALGSAVVMGLVAVLGTAVPLMVLKPEVLGTFRGVMAILGVVLTASGIAFSGWAGALRDRAGAKEKRGRGGYGLSVLLAIACGLLSPMFNYAFAFGQDVAGVAIRHGNSPLTAVYAVWPLALSGGLVPTMGYCGYLLRRNGSWGAFAPARRDVLLTLAMAILWTGSFALYGMSTVCLGALGTSVGWGITQIVVILAANASGIAAGEWTAVAARARRRLWIGMSLLAAAIGFLAAANQ